jgi:hypothetical protein
MKPRVALAMALTAAALLASAPAAGEGASASALAVSAEVKPSAVLRLQARTGSVAITEADIARGYVDVPAGALLSIDTGRLRPQVVADVPPGPGPFRSVEIRAAAAPVYRFNFSDKATPGSYGVPITVTIAL